MLDIMAMLATPMLTTTARGRLSPRLRLMLMLTWLMLELAMLATPMLPPTVLATPMLTTDLSMARGRLRPSPRLTTDTTVMDLAMLDIMAMLLAMLTPAMLTTERGRLRLSPRLTAMATDPPTDTPTLVPTPTVATAVDTSGDKSSDHATT